MTPEQCDLVEAHTNIARAAVRRAGVLHLRDELDGVALEALCRAAIVWTDGTRAYPFATFAKIRVKSRVRDFVVSWEAYSRRRQAPIFTTEPLDERDHAGEDGADSIIDRLDLAALLTDSGPDRVEPGVEYWDPVTTPFVWTRTPPQTRRLAS